MRDVVELAEGEHIEEDDVSGWSRWLIALLGLMLRRPQDTLAAGTASVALITVLVNALFLQPNPHPAPLFSVRPKVHPPAISDSTGAVIALPRPRPGVPASRLTEPAAKPAPAARTHSDIVTDIQRELARRGFYDGAVDGIHGSRTAAAVRALEQATGIVFGAEPSEPMLQAILQAPAAARAGAPRRGDPIADLVARTARQSGPSSPEPVANETPAAPVSSSAALDPGEGQVRPAAVPAPARSDAAANPAHQEQQASTAPARSNAPEPDDHPTPRGELPSEQVKIVQRALSDYGFGQLQPTGIIDAPTAAAIRDFEDTRGLPITGQMSERIVKELANVTEGSRE